MTPLPWRNGLCSVVSGSRNLCRLSGWDLTLAVCDGDGHGSEKQEAGASHSNPEKNFTGGIQHVLVACSCRKKGERGKSEARLSAVVSSSCGRAIKRSSRKGSHVALSEAGGRCR